MKGRIRLRHKQACIVGRGEEVGRAASTDLHLPRPVSASASACSPLQSSFCLCLCQASLYPPDLHLSSIYLSTPVPASSSTGLYHVGMGRGRDRYAVVDRGTRREVTVEAGRCARLDVKVVVEVFMPR